LIRLALVLFLSYMVAIGVGTYFMGQAGFSARFPPVLVYLTLMTFVILYNVIPRSTDSKSLVTQRVVLVTLLVIVVVHVWLFAEH
jgi:hypothetical protein